jgi:hypothetical protein
MTQRDTADLIRRLSTSGARVRPLASPETRVVIWLAVSLPYLLVVYLMWPHAGSAVIGHRFVVEEVAALLAGLTAAMAAFATVIPGRSRSVAWVPLVPLAIWLVSLGQRCARDWSGGEHALGIVLPHWGCVPATIIPGLVPAAALVMMLRRGAPMTPRLTLTLAAVAVASLADAAMGFIHVGDASLTVLTWHVVAVFALSGAIGMLGDSVLSWRKLLTASSVLRS